MQDSNLDVLLQQAEQAASQGAWGEALAALLEAADEHPEHAGAHSSLGACLLQMGRAGDSLPHFQRAAQLEPDLPEVYNNLGVACALAGLSQDAEQAYRKALDLDPEHLPAWKNLAVLYLDQGRPEEGVPILAALVQAHPADVEALLLLASCYEQAEDLVSARTLYQEALRHEPDHPQARAALERLNGHPAGGTRVARAEHARKLAGLKARRKGTAGDQTKDSQSDNE